METMGSSRFAEDHRRLSSAPDEFQQVCNDEVWSMDGAAAEHPDSNGSLLIEQHQELITDCYDAQESVSLILS
jgi:hypothetical protein